MLYTTHGLMTAADLADYRRDIPAHDVGDPHARPAMDYDESLPLPSSYGTPGRNIAQRCPDCGAERGEPCHPDCSSNW